MDNILALHYDLKYGHGVSIFRYRHGGYQHFRISDPKPRDIHKASVRDRLLHHALYRKLYPFFDRTFIADSYSCRKRKGTHKAMNRFREFAHKVSRNHTRTAWVLKCDIRKFFASIDQCILIDIVSRYIPDERIVQLLSEVISSFNTSPVLPTTVGHTGVVQSPKSEIGLPLGNLTSQLLVNIYMNEFDQLVKHRVTAKYYVRYADDFVFLSHDRREMESLLPHIRVFLESRLHLSLHSDKVFIKTLASGVDFLGWVHFPDHRVLRTATKRKMYRRLTNESNDAAKQSYRGMLSHGNAQRFSLKIDQVY